MKLNGRWAYILFVLIALAFFAIKISAVDFTINDENVYFYMGKLVAEGSIPYKDFFYAHPPLHLLLIAAVYKVFGFNFIALKSLAVLSTIITALFLFKTVKIKVSKEIGLAAVILFLFSFDVLRFSSFTMGVNLSLMFVMIGIYLVMKRSYFFSGLLFGLAGLTRFYSLVIVLIVAAVLFLNKRKEAMKFIGGFCAVFLTVTVLLLFIFGQSYFEPVFSFHVAKPDGDVGNFRLLWRSIQLNPLLYGLAALSLVVYRKKQTVLHFIVGAYLVFLLLFNSVFNYYYLILPPSQIVRISIIIKNLSVR